MPAAFCTYCSAHKADDPGEIPAIRRYQSVRIEAVFSVARRLGVAFYILSGEFGLLPPEQPIPWYDHLLSPEEVSQLAGCLTEQISRFGLTGLVYFTQGLAREPMVVPYHDTLVAACGRARIPLVVVELGARPLRPAATSS